MGLKVVQLGRWPAVCNQNERSEIRDLHYAGVMKIA